MNRNDLTLRVRSMTRDFTGSVFRDTDVYAYINEAIDRVKQVIPELEAMVYLDASDSVPTMMPSKYHHLLAVYSTSRCFGQDERHFQAGNYMNEFESKLQEFQQKVEGGDITIVDPITGEPVESAYKTDYVVDNYFEKRWGC